MHFEKNFVSERSQKFKEKWVLKWVPFLTNFVRAKFSKWLKLYFLEIWDSDESENEQKRGDIWISVKEFFLQILKVFSKNSDRFSLN